MASSEGRQWPASSLEAQHHGTGSIEQDRLLGGCPADESDHYENDRYKKAIGFHYNSWLSSFGRWLGFLGGVERFFFLALERTQQGEEDDVADGA